MAKKKKAKTKAKAGKKTAKKAAKKTAKKAAKKAGKKAAKKAAKKATKKTARKATKKAPRKSKAGRKPKAAAAKATPKKKKAAKKAKKVAPPAVAAVTEPVHAVETVETTPSEGSPASDEEEGHGLGIGDDAPAISAPVLNGDGDVWTLADHLGDKNIVLYFYPKDDTPGCTAEACAFQSELSSFTAHDTVVVGVSGDSLASHQKFANKYGLNFPLLSDTDHSIAKAYGVWVVKKMYGKESMGVQRSTFLIGKDGKIVNVWPKVKVEGHAEAVLSALKSL